MNNEVLAVKYINVKNCFLHLPVQRFRSLIGPTVCGLKVTTNSGRELYFSSSSMPCSLLDGDSVGISHTFASVIQIKNEEKVIVSPLYNLGSLQSISVTPKSENDFEILHSSAIKVESSLLGQLRIVWPHQVFPIWVSANISITLVVDSISPNLKYGRLEEYSEVIVATILPKNGIKTQTSIPSPLVSLLKENSLQFKKLKFRCVPLQNSCYSKFELHPYVVLTNKKLLPAWARDAIELNRKSVWRLTKCADDSKSVVVSIAFIEDSEQEHGTGDYKNICISHLLKNHLSLNIGEKVLLELINYNQLPEISGILITPLTSNGSLSEEVHKLFTQAVSSQDLLLNTKAPFPVRGSTVILTLRPLDVTWAYVSLHLLTSLSINVNKYVSEPITDINITQEEERNLLDNSSLTFEELLNEGRLALEFCLALRFKEGSKRVCDNVLYTGKSGCGKTWLAKCLLARLSKAPYFLHTEYISCCSLKGKRVEALSKYFSEILQKCCLFEPSVLCLDDIDLLASTSEENTEAAFHVKRISQKVAELLDAHQKKNAIAIVATAKSLENIDEQMLSKKGKCLFTTVIKIPNLSTHDRLEIIKSTFDSKIHNFENDLDYEYISQHTEGYTSLDLKKLCDKAIFEAWQRKAQGINNDLIITNEDVKLALELSKPSSLHQVNFYKGPKICWNDIGGLKLVKEKLIEVVCWSTMYPGVLEQCPVRPQTGVLLYGAPGTGKTLLAGALASESNMNFISIKGPELMSKYIGESEEGVRKLFEKSQAARPCLLFFDEFDSLAPRRGQDQTGVTDRVVNQLLTALDGVDPMSGVWVLAATSRPDLIDPAVLRPGRIGISIHCPLPNHEDRLEILKAFSSKLSLSEDVDINEVSEMAEGFTGADIKGLFTAAQIKAIDELHNEEGQLYADAAEIEFGGLEVKREHLMSALREVRPSLSDQEKERYQMIYDQFQGRRPTPLTQQKVTHA